MAGRGPAKQRFRMRCRSETPKSLPATTPTSSDHFCWTIQVNDQAKSSKHVSCIMSPFYKGNSCNPILFSQVKSIFGPTPIAMARTAMPRLSAGVSTNLAEQIILASCRWLQLADDADGSRFEHRPTFVFFSCFDIFKGKLHNLAHLLI